MPKKSPNFNFEESLVELDTLVNKLEEGSLSLEESLATFEQGIKLTRACQKHLNEAEQKVSLLIDDGEEGFTLKEFDEPKQ